MSQLLLGTNLKMYKGIAETVSFLSALAEKTADLRGQFTLFVVPSYTSLYSASQVIRHKEILLGAQNMHPAESGQFTGEVSPLMLRELGLDLVEIGHSERRHIFNETDEEENAKVLSALAHHFIALLCVGETAYDKENHISDEVLRLQLKIGLRGIPEDLAAKIWVAYEPVWAIGVNGVPAEPAYVQQRHQVIKTLLHGLFPQIEIPVLYGGSVNPGNASSLISLAGVDGLFIGRAAWEAENFNQLIRQVIPVWQEKVQNHVD